MDDAKHIALRALTGAFIDRDPSVVDRYFAPDYIQHNPVIPSGRTAIPGLIAGLSKESRSFPTSPAWSWRRAIW